MARGMTFLYGLDSEDIQPKVHLKYHKITILITNIKLTCEKFKEGMLDYLFSLLLSLNLYINDLIP